MGAAECRYKIYKSKAIWGFKVTWHSVKRFNLRHKITIMPIKKKNSIIKK